VEIDVKTPFSPFSDQATFKNIFTIQRFAVVREDIRPVEIDIFIFFQQTESLVNMRIEHVGDHNY